MLRTVAAAGATLGASGITSATPGRKPGAKPHEFLCGVSPSVDDVRGTLEAELPAAARVTHTNGRLGYGVVEMSGRGKRHAKRRALEAHVGRGGVEYVEDNLTLEAFLVPNDPLYDQQYAPQQVGCEEAWETTLGDADVTIAVVDQGVQYDHPDLDGTVDPRVGVDVVEGDGDPYPASADEDHGTHVAGIASGETDDGAGHAGISDCSYLSVRVLDESGLGSTADIADGIQWAADEGADVINLSLGGSQPTQTLENACEYAANQGSLLVGAAGNDYGAPVAYPAAYDTVVAVSALDRNEDLAAFSNVGEEIELAAPGEGVVSAVPFDNYVRKSGTSMAAPVVAGVAGLTLSAHPGLSNDALRSHLQETAVDVGLAEDEQGYGRVDADRAVNTAPGGNNDENGDGDGDGDDECGDETATASVESDLSDVWWDREDRYRYELRTADPCGATVSLSGPNDADFDLFVTLDGRSPTRTDYDEASAGVSADEEVVVALSGDEELGILVAAESGSGRYSLAVEERGR